jgi:Fibronectin type III domain
MTEPQLDPQGEAREALNSTVADFGQRILSDSRMIRSRMSDLLPDLPRERHLLVTAAEADVAGELAQHVQGQRLDPEIAIQMVSRSFSDRMSIDVASSTWVTTEYARALGYHVRSDAPLSPPPPAAATVGPGFYQGYSPPQAPAGGGVYGSPAPPAGGGGYTPTSQVPAAGHAPPSGVPLPGPPSPWMQPTPASPARTRHRWPVFALVGVAVLGLIAGLLVWAPWHKVPVAPAAIVGQSPTATSVLVSWSPSSGGAAIDHYLILRDGTQVGSVPASQTSYLDRGLAPGTAHRYRIIALSGTQRSQPSRIVVVRTITPSPVGLAAGQVTWTTEEFTWSHPPNGPTPSGYAVFVNGAQVVTVTGGTTSYSVTDLALATTYQYQVAAIWGSHQSRRSPLLAVTTLSPPLQGSVSLRYKTVSTPGSGASLKAGETWSDSWTFNPSCTANRCTLTTDGDFGPPGFKAAPFTVKLTGTGNAYTGSTTAPITMCGSVNVKNTVTVRIAASSGGVDNGAWNSWGGTMELSSPYATSGSEYCSPQSWTFSLTGT